MTQHAPPPLDPADAELTATEAESRRATRRRWLTLAEILGIAGLVIAGLTLWNNISIRRGQETDRVAEQQHESAAAANAEREDALVTLDSSVNDDGATLSLTDTSGHRIQNIQVLFPPTLGVPVQGSMLDPHIAASWISRPLLDLTDGGPDSVEGQVPILIISSYWQGEKPVSDTALYSLVFRTHGRMIGGRELKLRGIVLTSRVKSGTAASALNAAWATERERLKALKKN